MPGSEKAKRPYAKAVILITIFHHITTGIGSFSHWIRPTHRTVAMDIGVFGNLALVALGVAALVSGIPGEESQEGQQKKKPRKSK